MVVATWGCQAMLSILRVKVIIRNKEIFESEKNWYIMGNHMSYIDILMLLADRKINLTDVFLQFDRL